MLQAAAEVTQRGLAYITLLGNPETVRAEAEKMGIDLSLVDVVNPVVRGQGLGLEFRVSEERERRGRRMNITYADALVDPHSVPPSLPGLRSIRGRPRGGPQEEGAAA